MKRYSFIGLAMIGFVFIQCNSLKKNKSNKVEEYPKAELVKDFENMGESANVNILNVNVEGNLMKLSISYSGGCEKHTFKLIGSEAIQKSLPPKRGIMLYHNSNNDSCREMKEENLIFDISAFAYPEGEIILNLQGWENPISYTAAAK